MRTCAQPIIMRQRVGFTRDDRRVALQNRHSLTVLHAEAAAAVVAQFGTVGRQERVVVVCGRVRDRRQRPRAAFLLVQRGYLPAGS